MKLPTDIIATVRMYTADEGHAHAPFRVRELHDDCFRCPAQIDDKFFDCYVHVGALAQDTLEPGMTVVVPIGFRCPNFVMPKLQVGSRFKLWEIEFLAEALVQKICE